MTFVSASRPVDQIVRFSFKDFFRFEEKQQFLKFRLLSEPFLPYLILCEFNRVKVVIKLFAFHLQNNVSNKRLIFLLKYFSQIQEFSQE